MADAKKLWNKGQTKQKTTPAASSGPAAAAVDNIVKNTQSTAAGQKRVSQSAVDQMLANVQKSQYTTVSEAIRAGQKPVTAQPAQQSKITAGRESTTPLQKQTGSASIKDRLAKAAQTSRIGKDSTANKPLPTMTAGGALTGITSTAKPAVTDTVRKLNSLAADIRSNENDLINMNRRLTALRAKANKGDTSAAENYTRLADQYNKKFDSYVANIGIYNSLYQGEYRDQSIRQNYAQREYEEYRRQNRDAGVRQEYQQRRLEEELSAPRQIDIGKEGTRTIEHTPTRAEQAVGGALSYYGSGFAQAGGLIAKDLFREDGGQGHSATENVFNVGKSTEVAAAARAWDKVKAGGRDWADGLMKAGHELDERGEIQVKLAKQGLGTVGQALVDLGVVAIQMAGDIGIAAATGGSMLLPMGLRSYGNGYLTAEQMGYSGGQAELYGLGVAAVEVLSEKMFSVFSIAERYAKGVVKQEMSERVINAVVTRMAKSTTGRTALNRLMTLLFSAGSEGLEEVMAGIMEPVIRKATLDHSINVKQEIDWENTLYEGLIGGILGGLGGAVDLRNTRATYWKYYNEGLHDGIDRYIATVKEFGVGSEEAIAAAKDVWEGGPRKMQEIAGTIAGQPVTYHQLAALEAIDEHEYTAQDYGIMVSLGLDKYFENREAEFHQMLDTLKKEQARREAEQAAQAAAEAQPVQQAKQAEGEVVRLDTARSAQARAQAAPESAPELNGIPEEELTQEELNERQYGTGALDYLGEHTGLAQRMGQPVNQGGINNDTVSNGSSERNAGGRGWGEPGGLGGTAASSEGGPVPTERGYNGGVPQAPGRGGQRSVAISRQRLAAGIRRTSALDNGLDSTKVDNRALMQVWSDEMVAADSELSGINQRLTGLGFKVHFFSGRIGTASGGMARGAHERGNIWICVDDANWSATKIAMHEWLHGEIWRNPGLRAQLLKKLRTFDNGRLTEISHRYQEAMVLEGKSDKEAAEAILEEVMCDLYAGMNEFANEDTQTQGWHEEMQDEVRTRLAAEDQETRGPPEEGGAEFSEDEEGRGNKYGVTKKTTNAIQRIGKKSINEFSSDETKVSEPFARKFWQEMGVKSPFFRAWFGEWRAYDTTPITIVDVVRGKKYKSGSTTITDTIKPGDNSPDAKGTVISWGDALKRETITHQRSGGISADILGNIEALAQNAVLLDTQVSVPTGKSKMPDTAFMHAFYVMANDSTQVSLFKLFAEEALSAKEEVFMRAYELKDIVKVATFTNGVLPGTGGLTKVNIATINSVADLYDLVKAHDSQFTPAPEVDRALLNDDGTPKRMYRGDPEEFYIFDRGKAKPSGLYGRGFYFTSSPEHASRYGNVREFFLNVRRPLSPGQNKISKDQMRRFLQAVAEDEDYGLDNYGYGSTVESVLADIYGKGDLEMLQDVNASCIGDLVAALELFNQVNSTKYDGIVTPTETVVLDSTQIKSATDNIGTFDKENPDIRFSEVEEEEAQQETTRQADLQTTIQQLTEQVARLTDRLDGKTTEATEAVAAEAEPAPAQTETLEQAGVTYDPETESVAPTGIKFSEKTWSNSEYVKGRNAAAKEIAKALGISQAQARKYIDDINSVAKMIVDDRDRLDYIAAAGLSPFVSNAEYGGSFDFSTLCKKRRLFTGTFSAIQARLPNTALSPLDILHLRAMMKDAGMEVPCGLCYVEGSRAGMGKFSQEFIRLYEKYHPEADWLPSMTDVNTPDGVELMRQEHPEAYAEYERFWNNHGKLRDGDPNLFASQQKPKLYMARSAYDGEVLRYFKKKADIIEKNLNGGVRLQSFSDFEIANMIDVMQVIMDMSRVGLAGQAYTKVPEFALAFGGTGLKINLSLITKGLDENGQLIFDDVEGMPIDTALRIRDMYSDNVGTILVVFNDEQLRAAMADDRVDFIIPFHRSQWNKGQYEALGLPEGTKDFTDQQNEKYLVPKYHEYKGKQVETKIKPIMSNTYWEFDKDGKYNAEKYLRLCAEDGRRPVFYKQLVDNHDGSYSLQPDGSTDGYWKLLIDFKMYNNDGVGSEQRPVRPDFNMDEITRIMNEYEGGHEQFPVAQDIVDQFVEEYKANHTGAKFSEVEEEPGAGDYETVGDTARWTPERIDTLYDRYASSAMNYSKAYAAFISPEDFLSLTTANPERIEAESHELNEEELRAEPQPIYLHYDPESGELFGHEGRHRMVALRNAGVKRVAIAVEFLGEAGKYNRQPIDSLALTGEEWGNRKAPGRVTLTDLIPISRSFRQQIEQTFGAAKGDVRFSEVEDLDEEYMELAKDPEKNESRLAELVRKAATAARYVTPKLFHGTRNFGWTTYDWAHGNMIFATPNRDLAETYSGATDRSAITDTPSVDVDSLSPYELLTAAQKYLGNRYSEYELMTAHDKVELIRDDRKVISGSIQDAEDFIKSHSDTLTPEEVTATDNIKDALSRLATANNESDLQEAWDDCSSAIWDLKDFDDDFALDFVDAIGTRQLIYCKNEIEDCMYRGSMYAKKSSLGDSYVFDNQLALEIEAELHKGVYEFYADPGKQLVIDAGYENWNSIKPPDELNLYGPQNTRNIALAAKAAGYDSVLLRNVYDSGGETLYNQAQEVYIFLNWSDQIKSADPVTYDDDGNVIPLSERFRTDRTGEDEWKNDDIRFSEAEEEDEIRTVDELVNARKRAEQAKRYLQKTQRQMRLNPKESGLVDALMKGTLTEYELPRGVDKHGIMTVYRAKQAYREAMAPVDEYNKQRREQNYNEAERLTENSDEWKDKKNLFSYARETARRIFRDMAKDDAEAGALTRTYIDPIREHEAEKNRMVNRYNERIKKLNIETKKRAGNKVSEAYAIQYIGELEFIRDWLEQMPDGETRGGVTYGEARMLLDEFWRENPNFDEDRIHEAVAEFRSIYDEIFAMVNEARVLNGYAPIDYRKGYFPHFTSASADNIIQSLANGMGFNVEVTELPTSIAGTTHLFRPGIQWSGHMLKRTGNETDYNVLEGWDRYIPAVANIIYHTEDIQRLRALETVIRRKYSDTTVRDEIDSTRHSSDMTAEEINAKLDELFKRDVTQLNYFVQWLREYTNQLAGKKAELDRNVEKFIGRKFYQRIQQVENRVAANMLGGNISSAMTNFVPLFQAWGNVSTASMMRAMWDTGVGAIKGSNWRDGSSFLVNRRGYDAMYQTMYGKAKNALFMPFNWVDDFVSETVVRARYYDELKNNPQLPPEVALAEADVFAGSVMADRAIGELPTIFNSKNPLVKIFTMFQVEVNNDLSHLIKDVPKDVRKKGLASAFGALLKYMLGVYMFNDLFEWLFGRRVSIDPLSMLNDLVGDATGYELPNMFESAALIAKGEWQGWEEFENGKGGDFFSDLVGDLKEWLDDVPFISGLLGGGRFPIQAMLPEEGAVKAGYDALRDILKPEEDQENPDAYDWNKIYKTVKNPLYYWAMPAFGGQLRKIAEGIYAYTQHGSYSQTKQGKVLQYPILGYDDLVKSMIFGKTTTRYGKEWIESDFDSLTAPQTEAYINLVSGGSDPELIYQILHDLKGTDRTAVEKAYALAAAKLEDGERIMLFSALDRNKEAQNFADLMGAGLSFRQCADVLDEYRRLKDLEDQTAKGDEGTAERRRLSTEFSIFLADQGFDDKTINAVQEVYDMQVKPIRYDWLTAAGIHREGAMELALDWSELEPRGNSSKVTDNQKVMAVADAGYLSENEKHMAIRTLLTEDEAAKYNQYIVDYQIPVETYGNYIELSYDLKADDLDGDGKGDAYSLAKKKFAVIDTLPLQPGQKTALAIYASGNKESTVRKYAPWLQ